MSHVHMVVLMLDHLDVNRVAILKFLWCNARDVEARRFLHQQQYHHKGSTEPVVSISMCN